MILARIELKDQVTGEVYDIMEFNVGDEVDIMRLERMVRSAVYTRLEELLQKGRGKPEPPAPS